jgi:uncharacterized membrane protein YccC
MLTAMNRPTSNIGSALMRLSDLIRRRNVELRQCVRATAAALLSFVLAEFLQVPLVLWVVLTALIVTQMSVGGSLKATFDYLVGTLGGAVYGGAVATLLPHGNDLALAAVLAAAVAPLALLAAINPSFRAAPITASIVLLGPTTAQSGPIGSAIERVIEVALGSISGLAVSLWVLPARAHLLTFEAAARMLDLMADVLPDLCSGFSRSLELSAIREMQNRIGAALARLDSISAEARRERLTLDPSEPDLAPLLRTLLRLRHDLVIAGRAAVAPLPDALQPRLGGALARVTAAAAEYLRGCAAALLARREPPALTATDAALEAYSDEIAGIRREQLMRQMPGEVVERIFALGFALEQMHQNFRDLGRCVAESASASKAAGKAATDGAR